jgi:hypothetical protein
MSRPRDLRAVYFEEVLLVWWSKWAEYEYAQISYRDATNTDRHVAQSTRVLLLRGCLESRRPTEEEIWKVVEVRGGGYEGSLCWWCVDFWC